MHQGLVIETQRRHTVVLLNTGERIRCLSKGRTLQFACGDTVSLTRTNDRDGVIESVGEIRGTMLDDDNRETEISMGIQGTVRRSLDRAVDLDGTSQGAMKLSGEVVQDGVAVTMSVTGRYTARITGTLR